jgi:hypothetical protein
MIVQVYFSEYIFQNLFITSDYILTSYYKNSIYFSVWIVQSIKGSIGL